MAWPLIQPFVFAFLGGFLPIFIWLWFLEHEDKNPEPHKLTVYAFLAGMLAVAVVIPIELLISNIQDKNLMIILWAATEEIVKFALTYIFVLRRMENDEPIDSLMYLIVAALGFAALENTLYILGPIFAGNYSEAWITGNFRFMGATLLHVVSSSIPGIALAFSYYKNLSDKRLYLFFGLVGATLLHTVFNLSIIIYDGTSKVMISFYTVWIACIILLLFFEKIKKIKNPINK